MNVQWRTAIYVTGYSTKGKLYTRFDRRTCTHEQEHIKTYSPWARGQIFRNWYHPEGQRLIWVF